MEEIEYDVSLPLKNAGDGMHPKANHAHGKKKKKLNSKANSHVKKKSLTKKIDNCH